MKSGGFAEFFEQLSDLRAAAMHDDRIDADQFHQDDVAREAVFERFIDHRIAAEFDDDGFAFEALNIGQGFDQDIGDLVGCFVSASFSGFPY